MQAAYVRYDEIVETIDPNERETFDKIVDVTAGGKTTRERVRPCRAPLPEADGRLR